MCNDYLSAKYTPNITSAPPIIVNTVMTSPNRSHANIAVTTGTKYRNIATFEAFSHFIDLFQHIYAKTEHKRDKYKIDPIPNFVIFLMKENLDSKNAIGNKNIVPKRKVKEVIERGVFSSIIFFPTIE